jgi:hypothetical protein
MKRLDCFGFVKEPNPKRILNDPNSTNSEKSSPLIDISNQSSIQNPTTSTDTNEFFRRKICTSYKIENSENPRELLGHHPFSTPLPSDEKLPPLSKLDIALAVNKRLADNEKKDFLLDFWNPPNIYSAYRVCVGKDVR